MAEREHIHFVTGRLAEPSLRKMVGQLAADADFDWSLDVLPITVAALMTPQWIAPRIAPPSATTKVLLPGYCTGDLRAVEESAQRPVERGPKDLRELPAYFGNRAASAVYGEYAAADSKRNLVDTSHPRTSGSDPRSVYTIEIIAEINHCPRLTLAEVLAAANELARDGADIIDVGCEPGETWSGVANCVRALRNEGHRVSIDSLNPREIGAAVESGAELVLSVNSGNREAAPDWGAEVVTIPDIPSSLEQFDETIEFLSSRNIRFRLDPVLEPIGFGFAASLGRYLQTRQRYSDRPMMMGLGNITELTDADSAGINVVLLGFCEELRIGSVLTTQVINWARTSVRECDLARRLVAYAISRHELPKHVEPRLVTLRDETVTSPTADELRDLAASLRDHNYRVYSADGEIHLVSGGLHLHAADPFLLLEQLLAAGPAGRPPKNLDASHAFYLGFECCKALIALTLSKQYRQDDALDWGYLTRPEVHHRLQPKPPATRPRGEDGADE